MSKKDEDDTALAAEEPGADADATFDVEMADSADDTADEPDVVDAVDAPPAPSGARRGAGVAWLALFVAIVAAVIASYSALTDWRADRTAARRTDPLLDLRSRIANSDEALARIDAALADLESSDAGFADQVDLLRDDFDGRLQRLDSLPSRIANLENSLAALQGISTGARNTWLLAEAEYYMQIANAQLQLANNPQLAALALGMADDRVAQLGDPALTEVRGAIADELAAIDGMNTIDIEGVTLTLASLARVVDTLPLRPVDSPGDEAVELPAEDAGSLERAWASVKGVAGSLVQHSKPGENELPLVSLSPDAEYFLRTNLTLQLQAARLALLQGEPSVFRQSLDDAADWIGLYFDPGNTQVASAVDTIAEIREVAVASEKPDISESLRLLRQFRTLSETAQ